MKIKFTRPTVYVSHPIRGSTGDIEGNCKKASAAARRLRRVFPEVDFYVPAEHDLTLQILTADNRLSIDDIMYADLQVLAVCHGWMFYMFDESAGSLIEWQEANDMGLNLNNKDGCSPNVFLYDIEKVSYEKLRKDFANLVADTKKRFRNHQERN